MSYRPSTAIASDSAQLDGLPGTAYVTKNFGNPGYMGKAKWTTGDAGVPTAGETITIGAETYEWDGVGANINVPIGVDLDTCLNTLLLAINTNTTENVGAWPDAPSPATTYIFLNSTDTPGGVPVSGVLPTLAASQVADPWYEVVAGSGEGPITFEITVPITAENANAPFDISVPVTNILEVRGEVVGANGEDATTTAQISIANPTTITVIPNAGGTPLVATDIYHIIIKAEI